MFKDSHIQHWDMFKEWSDPRFGISAYDYLCGDTFANDQDQNMWIQKSEFPLECRVGGIANLIL